MSAIEQRSTFPTTSKRRCAALRAGRSPGSRRSSRTCTTSPARGPAAAVRSGWPRSSRRRGTRPPCRSSLDAGATITGKTICEELFYSMVGVNAHYGMPANLRAPGRIPGGSSSGSAAACGAGACDFALGSDTAGSIRIPASFNGVYGIRTTHGRVDLTGAMAMAPTFDAAGWFASVARHPAARRRRAVAWRGGARSGDAAARRQGPVHGRRR